MKPQLNLIHIDTSRIGGSTAAHRHAFGMAPAKPKEPQKQEMVPSAPPPKRVLAEGRPTPPELTQGEIASIQARLGELSEALKLELEAVKVEADTVTAKDLGDMGSYRIIPIVGEIFEPPEIRSQVVRDSNSIATLSGRVLSGSAGPYLTDGQRQTLETVVSDAQALAGFVRQFPVMEPEGRLVMFAEDHAAMHTKAANDLLSAIERRVVMGEAGSIPVNEPSSFPLGGLLAIAALIAIGVVVWELS